MLRSAPLWVLAFCGLAVAQDKLFPAEAVVDVTHAPYHVKPNDGVDDTVAIQKAITDNLGTGRSLYFPAGVYDVSDSLISRDKNGFWECHITFQGQHRDKTIFKLADGAKGFGDKAKPKAVIVTASHWNEGDDNVGPGGGNKAFRNNIFDLSIDTGRGNPGAIGIEWANSNWGGIENVRVSSGDEAGSAGIAMKRAIPGPGFIKQVEIRGFDVGIDTADIQYGVTMEHIDLYDQKIAGIRTDKNLLHIRRLISANEATALSVTGIEGMLTLVDSHLIDVGGGDLSIENSGNMTLQNVKIRSLNSSALRSKGRRIDIVGTETWHDPAPIGRPGGKPLIEAKETPTYWNTDLSDWIAVGARKEGEPDDTAAIQRAFDSGKSTVYFPNNRVYFLSDTVIARGKLRQVMGMGAEISLGAAEKPFSDSANPRPLIRIDPTDHDAIFFENMFFNAQYPGEVLFENNTPKTVVIRHSGGWVGSKQFKRSYRNTDRATGEVFIEDVFLPGWSFKNQSVWARQFNPENQENNDGTIPQVENVGGTLWILGFKTEGQAPFLVTRAKGKTELLGAYNYLSATHPPTVPQDAVPYIIEDAEASLTFLTENFRDSDYRTYIREIKNGQVIKDWPRSALPPRNGRPGDRAVAVTAFRSQ